jgi:hypothetical protein
MSVENIKSWYEEFVSILLLIAGQMLRVGPDEMEESEWYIRLSEAIVELLEDAAELAHQTLVGRYRWCRVARETEPVAGGGSRRDCTRGGEG